MRSDGEGQPGDACVAPTQRRSMSLKSYDYAGAGAYFVTVCTRGRVCFFGDVIDGSVQLNESGMIASACWNSIPEHFRDVHVDRFVVMPNHVHGILWINPVGATHASPRFPSPNKVRGTVHKPRSLGAIVGSFKSAVTKRRNRSYGTLGTTIWQRNYYRACLIKLTFPEAQCSVFRLSTRCRT